MTLRPRAALMVAAPLWIALAACSGGDEPLTPSSSPATTAGRSAPTAPGSMSTGAMSTAATATPAAASPTNAPLLTAAQALAQSPCSRVNARQVSTAFGVSKVDEVTAGSFDTAVLLFDTCTIQVSGKRGYVPVQLGWSASRVTRPQFETYRKTVGSQTGRPTTTTRLGSASFTFVNGAAALIQDRVLTVDVRALDAGGPQSAAVLAMIVPGATPPPHEPLRTTPACERAARAAATALGAEPQVVRGSSGQRKECGWWTPASSLLVTVRAPDTALATDYIARMDKDPTMQKVAGFGRAARYATYPDGTVLVARTTAGELVVASTSPGRVPSPRSLVAVAAALVTP